MTRQDIISASWFSGWRCYRQAIGGSPADWGTPGGYVLWVSSHELLGSGNIHQEAAEVIAHSKYWIPGFKFQTLELVVRLIWMCCKWATIDPPNIVPTNWSEFSLYPLSPRTNHSSVLWPLDQPEDRITEPSCPSWLLVRCQQDPGGWGKVFWFRCYPVILATSDSYFKL